VGQEKHKMQVNYTVKSVFMNFNQKTFDIGEVVGVTLTLLTYSHCINSVLSVVLLKYDRNCWNFVACR